ncbi:hypothetical protein [Rhodococcus koreensis]
MTDDDDRRAITAAMQRLFAGTPLRSSGKLDIVTLAQEAGVKRNKLTHKHTDLKDLFYVQRRTRHGIPDDEVKLREQIATLQKSNQSLRDERDRYRVSGLVGGAEFGPSPPARWSACCAVMAGAGSAR